MGCYYFDETHPQAGSSRPTGIPVGSINLRHQVNTTDQKLYIYNYIIICGTMFLLNEVGQEEGKLVPFYLLYP